MAMTESFPKEEEKEQDWNPEGMAHAAVGKKGMMGQSGLGMRKKARREGRPPCQGKEMEEGEATEVAGAGPEGHTAPFAQQRRQ